MPINTTMLCAAGEFSVFRFPKNQHDAALQAWDSADELAIEYITQHHENKRLLILNDQFGALTVGLHQFNRTLLTDSYVSQLATKLNCEENEQAEPIFLSSIKSPPERELIVIKLTKNLAYLETQLAQLQDHNAGVEIIACGKTTQITSKVMAIFDQYCDDVKTSLAKKKSRLLFAKVKTAASSTETLRMSEVDWPEQSLTIKAYSNVFSHDSLDIGGRFLAENLPAIKENARVIDLGCGNGLVGLAALGQNAIPFSLMFVDESTMAVASAETNAELNFADHPATVSFKQDDCLSKIKPESADMIFCNPPFHQQNTITEHIAKQMFRQAKTTLKNGGELYVVANRHLPYQSYLKKLFGGFKVHAQNKKFIVYHCQKRT